MEAQAARIDELEQQMAALTSKIDEMSEPDEPPSAADVPYDDAVTALGAQTVQEAVEAVSSALANATAQSTAGDDELASALTALQQDQQDMQEQLDEPPGPRPCPEGMLPVNDTYCVEKAQQPDELFVNANLDCRLRDRRLCSTAELAGACHSLGFEGFEIDWYDDAFEWVDDVMGLPPNSGDVSSPVMAALGGELCESVLEAPIDNPVTLLPYRCCLTR